MKKTKTIIGFLTPIFISVLSVSISVAQDANGLLQKVKAKIDQVKDYEADGKMKTNVVFLKVPVADVKVFFKNPNKLKIKNDKGFSFVPKGAVSLNINNIINNGKYSVIDAGTDKTTGVLLKVLKLLPDDENGDIVLSVLYIDEANLVIKKAKTTTRENGSYELEMVYGKYMKYALPDKISFSFNIKDYKLPKGVTFDFDDGTSTKKSAEAVKNSKGKAEITFNTYTINKGISDAVFK